MYECRIAGTGRYVPEKVLTNTDLEKIVETSDEWIIKRTGIRERRIAAEDQSTSDLALEAARVALDRAGLAAEDLDAIILATLTPDTYCPAGACYVQNLLGATNACAFDLSAACTGFVYGITVGSSLVRAGIHKNVLVLGAETLSRFIDYTDRNTCILFGDGAGAAVLSRAEEGSDSRLLDHYLRSDGGGTDLIIMPGGGARRPSSHDTVDGKMHFLSMQGNDVFKFATKSMQALIETAIERNGLSVDDLDLVVPHQVNSRIIDTVLRKVDIPKEKIYLNLQRYGNTSAASVPMALHEAVEEGRVQAGNLVLLVAFGAGLTWGYNLVRW
ncbi:MAG: ketoacyl-ACP synthase III [Planctomycetota bacterium]|jgi:3-oxoacyl-[acyl-carrier-protein] synthase-3|nr:ketoacyl-ACP synthase III [Planctomycetota bacterium]HBO52653.1 3-oxoacyl-ACP synthase [Planctomycetota bacterium]|tara:strand:- start:1210 stop:2196 length:987 start_codon:yes stop_codon:yes gene_type:complete